MSLKNIALFGIIAVLILAYVAWTRNTQKPASPTQTEAPAVGEAQGMPPAGDATGGDQGGMPPGGAPPQAQPPMVESATNPGLAWSVPSGWTDQGGSSMRLATYVFHGANNTEAQCAVYYFGPGQGGTASANLDRWRGEFKDTKSQTSDKLTAHGIPIERIVLTGTYMAHVGMMGSGSSTEMTNWSLLGAIAEGSNGSVFFKMTGPEATVKSATAGFAGMLKSIRKE